MSTGSGVDQIVATRSLIRAISIRLRSTTETFLTAWRRSSPCITALQCLPMKRPSVHLSPRLVCIPLHMTRSSSVKRAALRMTSSELTSPYVRPSILLGYAVRKDLTTRSPHEAKTPSGPIVQVHNVSRSSGWTFSKLSAGGALMETFQDGTRYLDKTRVMAHQGTPYPGVPGQVLDALE